MTCTKTYLEANGDRLACFRNGDLVARVKTVHIGGAIFNSEITLKNIKTAAIVRIETSTPFGQFAEVGDKNDYLLGLASRHLGA